MQVQKFLTTLSWALVSGFVGSGVTFLVEKLLNRYRKEPMIESWFFSPKDTHRAPRSCRSVFCPLCNCNKLRALMRTTERRIDVCMYLITDPQITSILFALFKRGVSIRILTDKQMSEEANKCKSEVLSKNHIPLRYLEAKGMMHNKFLVIDSKIVVTGSCNWTVNGLTCNYENLVVIRDEKVAREFTTYFNDLWAYNSFT